MDPIKPLGQILRALRSNSTTSRNAGSTPESGTTADSTSTESSAASNKPEEGLVRLEALLRTRFGNGGRNQHFARRLFVETVLLSELGEELAADPGFGRLLDQVTSEMAGDQEIAAELDQYLERLMG